MRCHAGTDPDPDQNPLMTDSGISSDVGCCPEAHTLTGQKPKPDEPATVERNKDGEPYISVSEGHDERAADVKIGKTRRVTVRRFKGKVLVDVREVSHVASPHLCTSPGKC